MNNVGLEALMTGADRDEEGVANEAVWQQLKRILNSRVFSSSVRLSRFLDYIVTKSIEGNRDHIREYSIGVDVFDRGEGFDCRIDSVVRVEARRLRRMLTDYYLSEGSGDDIRIEVPKGSYAPAISRIERPSDSPAPANATECKAAASIAVLPFTDLSPEHDQEHFCDGISEQLIDLLTAVEGIRAVSRTSSFAFKGRHQDIREIGEKLGAQWIVEGSVRKSGDTLRVSARLCRCENGFQVWARSYDRSAFDIFEIQDEIGGAILTALKGYVGIAAAQPQAARTRNAQAYDHFLRGRFHYAKQNRPGLRNAIECFEHAIAEDSGFGAAHAALSRCYRQSALFGLLPANDAMPKARAAALRALELDPMNGEAEGALAGVLATFDLDWDGAQAAYEEALHSKPAANIARYSYALFFLIPKQRFREALEQLDRITETDPLSPLNEVAKSWTHFFAGDFERAVSQARSALEKNESSVMGYLALGWALSEAGRAAESVEILERARALAGDSSIVLGSLGYAYTKAGREREAREILKQDASFSPYDSALIHAGLGDREKALEALEDALRQRCPRQVWIGAEPRFASLRRDSRFRKLLAKLGLRQDNPMAQSPATVTSPGQSTAHSTWKVPHRNHRRKQYMRP